MLRVQRTKRFKLWQRGGVVIGDQQSTCCLDRRSCDW
jgi:hypothetical protein